MINFIESFRKIQQDRVGLTFLVKALREVTQSSKKLGFARPLLTETVLKGGQEILGIEKRTYIAMNNVFE